MFVFYDIDDLLLLQAVRVLNSINVPILVAEGKLKYHNHITVGRLNMLREQGLITIKCLDDPGYEFVRSNRKLFAAAGCQLLEVIYLCRSNNAILIVEESETLIVSLANFFSVKTATLEEFNSVTINNKEYFDFINEMKKDKQRLNL